MKEMQNIVNEEVKRMSESGEIQAYIETGVKQAISRAIERQFESYGNITKQLEEAFKENLLIDNRNLDIPSINAVMTEVVRTNINEFYKGQAADKLHKLMEEKLAPLPNTMAINDFIKLLCEEWKVEDHSYFDDVDEYATVEMDDSLGHGLISLKMWKMKETNYGSAHSEDLHITLTKGKGEDSYTLQGRHGSTDPYYLFDVDALVFKAYAQGVVFTGVDAFDADDCDLQLKSYGY